MKKCPMKIDKEYPMYGGISQNVVKNSYDCIGAQCAAYVEREFDYDSVNSHTGDADMTHVHQWSCAMMPREVWNDVEDSNA